MSGRFGKPDASGRSSGKIGGRAGKLMKPPQGEPWIWLTRELLQSEAWQSLGINARRFIDRLLIEHMNHAGTENGRLKTTYAQLEEFGLTSRCIAGAIAEAEAVGLVDVHRGGRHVAATYTLTFYPLPNGTPASNRWKLYRAPQIRKSTPTSERTLPQQVRAIRAELPPQVKAVVTPTSEGASISRTGTPTNSSDIAKLPWHTPTYEIIELSAAKRRKPTTTTEPSLERQRCAIAKHTLPPSPSSGGLTAILPNGERVGVTIERGGVVKRAGASDNSGTTTT